MLYFERRELPDEDLEESYKVTICKLNSLGYQGSGDKVRDFDLSRFLNEISIKVLDQSQSSHRVGYNWEAFDIDSKEICSDKTFRFDFKYWNTDTREKISTIFNQYKTNISDINTITTTRGISPPADSYVDEPEGYAVVIKSGSNISKQGSIITKDADWIEKSVYDDFIAQSISMKSNRNIIKKGDILLSSTGDGTLGKSAVYDLDYPAIADGHVTIIRVNKSVIDPYYLCDYLRAGFGSIQVSRLYTGSTGMIELTPDQVDSIAIDMRSSLKEQKTLSKNMRSLELKYLKTLKEAETINEDALRVLLKASN